MADGRQRALGIRKGGCEITCEALKESLFSCACCHGRYRNSVMVAWKASWVAGTRYSCSPAPPYLLICVHADMQTGSVP